MDDPYVTLENPYIESVWHILGTIHEKDYCIKGIEFHHIAQVVKLH